MLSIYILLILISCNNDSDKNSIDASGTIESKTIVISSQIAGPIKSILKDEGDKLNRGDTILLIDTELYDIQLRQAKAGLDFAKSQLQLIRKGARYEDVQQIKELLNQAEANFLLAKEDSIRITSLYESNSVTKKQLDDAITKYRISYSQYQAARENYNKIRNYSRPEEIAQAEANYQKALASLDLIKKNINDCYVTSPIDGFITKSFIEVGETVSMLSSLVKVANLYEVELVIYISEQEIGKVKLGQEVEIKIDSYKDKTYEGKIIFISPEAEFTPKNIQTKDERTKLVFAVKIKIPNENLELKSGLPADAKIIL
ncbi:MAG: efflux RND transporter periplasmic adaptor subunit [Ignavibacteriales bacterium]|nr:efflux RND transporter periplasmic adaptor subunit [Ignavibacteriales bacterium]